VTGVWTPEGLPALHFRVSQLLARYARGVDRRDWPLLRSLFHEDSLDEHGFTTGGVDEFIEAFATRSADVPEMTHFITNVLILETDPQRREVLVETYCLGCSRVRPEQMLPGSFYDSPLIPADSANGRLAIIANRYLDLIVEDAGELTFLYRRGIFEWVAVAEVEAVPPFAPSMITSTRNSDDPGRRTLEEFRQEYLSRRQDAADQAS
jgi:hypothetical protein